MTFLRVRCVMAAAAGAVALALAGAPAVEADPRVEYQCSPAPLDCSGWYRSDVTIRWTVDGAANPACPEQPITFDTVGATVSCKAADANGTVVTIEKKIRRDVTPPTIIGGAPARAADSSGWYNHPVAIAFTGSDQTSGIAACTGTTYGGPDTGSASVSGFCTDNAGNTSSALPYGLKYDETGPEVADARPERGPDHAGWFNRPVRFDVFGSDATSGLADCPPVIYSGPDGSTLLRAACSDRAGNATTRSFGLRFDDTAPVIARLKAAAGDRRIDVRWKRVPDAESVEVIRSPGLANAPESVVFSGPGERFRDGAVANGRRYAYRVRITDAAGNTGLRSISAKAGPRLISPASGASRKATRPPLLRWTPVRRAGYYNLQIFRGGRKVLSAWPEGPRYRLKQAWTYGGIRHRLSKGTYRWYVWPGYGNRSKRNFGRLIGSRTLRITE